MSKNTLSENYYDDEDCITFQFKSNTIHFYYSHLSRYSSLIRNNFLLLDVKNRLPDELSNFQSQNSISTESIILFFQLLQKDFNIDQNLTYNQYLDLYKISEFLQVKKLTISLKQYFDNHNVDIDFQIQIILENLKNKNVSEISKFHINEQIEDLLSSKIEECLQNEKFSNFPPPLIYRIVTKSDKKRLRSDILFDFIKKNVKSFFTLFTLLDIRSLSEGRFNELAESFEEPNGAWKDYLWFIPCNLSFINDLKKDKKNLHKQLDDLQNEKVQMQAKLGQLEKEKNKIQIDLQTEKTRVEQEKKLLLQQFKGVKREKEDLQTEKDRVEQEKNFLLQQFEGVKREKEELQKKLEDYKYLITGTITASVKGGLFFYADINLTEKNSALDTQRSKYIVSQSSEESLGAEAYENGQPITSLRQRTADFGGKAGTYYIRAYVVNRRGMSVEFVSNPVTTSGPAMLFGFEGKAANVLLPSGRYRLEVWGAQGGRSTSQSNSKRGDGGLGGYSAGDLSLQKETMLFVYVGGQGKPANFSDGAETSGSFPDGGGTKTGHYSSYTSVPGTGGGSTSIRLSTDSLYSRVIVAGGGGGAGGDGGWSDRGGFGGGVCGGNSYCAGCGPRDQGAGTQTGSTPGPRGTGVAGVSGTFGQGATGLYKQNCDSGGGGGGGWYGGGSGGHGGSCNCASGGGGSGWIFTESSMRTWESGDPSNSGHFTLDTTFYLTNAETKAGNTSFPGPNGGNETGHEGDGYAKIIPM